jgi:hypothetical protein
VDLNDSTVPERQLDRFRYAPIVAISFIPFAACPDAIGGVLWRLVNGMVFLTGAVAFARSVFPGRANLNAKTATMLGILLLPLSIGSINNGQSNILIIGCLMLGTAAVADGRQNLAALSFTVPMLFKVYPVSVLGLVLLVQPRLGWRVAAILTLGCMLPFATQDPGFVTQAYGSWIGQVANDNRHTNTLQNSYRDFHLLLRLIGAPIAENAYHVIQIGMAIGLAVLVLRSKRLGCAKTTQLRMAFDLGSCWIILFGPATENSTYALLAPTLALAVWESLQVGHPVWQRWWLAATVSLFVAGVIVIATPWGKSISFYLMPLGALFLFAERVFDSCCKSALSSSGRSAGDGPAPPVACAPG